MDRCCTIDSFTVALRNDCVTLPFLFSYSDSVLIWEANEERGSDQGESDFQDKGKAAWPVGRYDTGSKRIKGNTVNRHGTLAMAGCCFCCASGPEVGAAAAGKGRPVAKRKHGKRENPAGQGWAELGRARRGAAEPFFGSCIAWMDCMDACMQAAC